MEGNPVVLNDGARDVGHARHQARCSICSHPERRTIEEVFRYRQMSVAEITKRYGIGHDAMYRHAHAINLLPARNRNWRAPIQSDNIEFDDNERSATAPIVQEVVAVRAELPSSPHARTIVDLLGIASSDRMLSAVERAIESKVHNENISTDIAANDIFVAAALVKISRPPDSWLTWFQERSKTTGQ